MNKLQVPRAKILLIFLFCFVFQAHLNVIATSNQSSYTPTDQIFVSCGSSGGMDSNGRNWIGDLKPSGFRLSEPTSNKSTAASATNQGSSDGIPYTNARISCSTFVYLFDVPPGKKFLRLHFNPDVYQGLNKSGAYIDVKTGNHLLLWNFSASVYSAIWSEPSFVIEYCVSVVRGEQLNVSFSPSDYEESYVFINGIEIVSMPDELYYPPNTSTGPPLIGRNKEYYSIGDHTVMEKVCRLNVGGYPISKMDDTGMYRTWYRDGRYMYPPYGVTPVAPNVILNFSGIPRYIAPEDLYKSARSMGTDRLQNEMTNMTWGVLVESAFDHLVRLHFCEFDALTEINDRRFMIYIDNQTAEARFDVMEASGGKNIPIYRDYVVRAAKGSGTSVYIIFIKLHPHPSSVYADAILNGLEVFKLSDSDGNIATPINADMPASPPSPAPVPAPVRIPPRADKKSINKVTLYGLIGGGGLFCLLMIFLMCLVLAWTLKKRKKNHEHRTDPDSSICSWFLKPSCSKSSREGSSSSLPKDLCRKFTLSEINSATDSFHRDMIIGRGGFGYVYRGNIRMDETCKTVVAIKRLDLESSHQGAKEFKAEIEMLSQLRHANLVSLIGYCNDKGEMVLVYEYISNGTLDSHLYGTNKDPIPWRRRLEICIGAARGLHYLHEGAVNKIIHRDVKTTNILIDENWKAKVSDFGLSKMFLEGKSVTTVVKGTKGYIDPEYYRGQALTEKSDVYSFGVVLLEVLFARKAVAGTLEEDQRGLVGWAQKCIRQGTIHEAIDPYLMGRITPECFNMFVDIAERCVRNQGLSRPSMRDVMDTLEFALKLQDAADSEQIKKANDDQSDAGGVGGCVYPCVPFRAPPVYKLGEIGDDDDDGSDSDFGPVDLGDQDVGTSKSGSVFSGTTSRSSVY